MSPTRRDFIRISGSIAGALGLTGLLACDSEVDDPGSSGDAAGEPAPNPLRILILGGTGIVGPHQVARARERNHVLTLFNRGVTNPDLFPGVEQLRGDRAVGDYSSLSGREWDVVIDNSAREVGWARDAISTLDGRVGGYLYISSTGVYFPLDAATRRAVAENRVTIDETFPTHPERSEEARIEQVVLDAFPDTGAIVRPTFMTGPGDTAGWLLHYPLRLSEGGEVLVPPASDPAQLVDVRDATRFMIHMVERGMAGIYNITGPEPGPYSIGQYIEAIQEVVGSGATLTMVDTDFLVDQGVRFILPWAAPVGETLGFMEIDGGKAVGAGMVHRPVTETVADALEWYRGLPEERQARINPQFMPWDEAAVLAAWHEAERGGTAGPP